MTDGMTINDGGDDMSYDTTKNGPNNISVVWAAVNFKMSSPIVTSCLFMYVVDIQIYILCSNFIQLNFLVFLMEW
jgi:hypothetical protein